MMSNPSWKETLIGENYDVACHLTTLEQARCENRINGMCVFADVVGFRATTSPRGVSHVRSLRMDSSEPHVSVIVAAEKQAGDTRTTILAAN